MANLININSKRSPAQGSTLASRTTLIDKFFLLGAAGCLVGTTWLGLHLWLMANGKMEMPQNYIRLRATHAFLQYYLFVGSFILGFCLHAGPKFLNVSIEASKHYLWLIPLIVLGSVLAWYVPTSLIGSTLVAIAFAIPTLFFAKLLVNTDRSKILSLGIPVFAGLVTLSGGTFANLGSPTTAIYIMWFGIMPIIFGTGQQFLSGFSGCRIMPHRFALGFLVLYLFSAAFSAWEHRTLFATFCFLSTITYLFGTNALRVVLHPFSSSLNLAFASGLFWLIYGIYFLSLGGGYWDRSLHMWASGFIFSLLLSTSSKIIGFMALKPVLSERTQMTMLILWQIVPVGRSLRDTLFLSYSFSYLVSAIMTIVALTWCVMLAIRCVQIMKRRIT